MVRRGARGGAGCTSARITAIRATVEDRTILVFSVYMPTDATDNLTEFTECLSEVNAVIENSSIEAVYILGDFNAHPTAPFGKELFNFCSEQSWKCADVDMLGMSSDSYTFVCDAHGSTSWLDHCVVSVSAWQTIKNITIDYNTYWSDHLPLIIECNLNFVRPKDIKNYLISNKVKWGQRGIDQINKYFEICNNELKLIEFPTEFILCSNGQCNQVEHRQILEFMYNKNFDSSFKVQLR